MTTTTITEAPPEPTYVAESRQVLDGEASAMDVGIDMQTANVITKVWDRLRPDQAEVAGRWPLEKFVEFCWRVVR